MSGQRRRNAAAIDVTYLYAAISASQCQLSAIWTEGNNLNPSDSIIQ